MFKNSIVKVWNKFLTIIITLVMVVVSALTFFDVFFDNAIKIYIGYQSVTSQTWTALIIKNKKIFENKINEIFPDKNIKVVWSDEISGAVINTAMISGKCQFGFMGDMPLLLNMNKSYTIEDYESRLLCFCSNGVDGKNQSVLVPFNSNVNSIYDLKGKRISVPIGSSAHFMLLNVLNKYGIINDVEITHQDIGLSSQMLNSDKVDAFSIWAPYPNFLTAKGIGKEIVSGVETGIDYQAGVMVEYNWARQNPEIVQLFVDSIIEANGFITENPEDAAKIFSQESGFDEKITLKEAKNITWTHEVSDASINVLQGKLEFLKSNNQLKNHYQVKDFIYK